jgi:uncharacterized protein
MLHDIFDFMYIIDVYHRQAVRSPAGQRMEETPMTTLATAFWRRLDVPGHDAARMSRIASGYELVGQSVFLDPRGPAALRYMLDLADDWSTREGHVTGLIGERNINTRITRGTRGWVLNGKGFGMANVADLDLSFTPATNMAQLKRVNLSLGDGAKFDVA